MLDIKLLNKTGELKFRNEATCGYIQVWDGCDRYMKRVKSYILFINIRHTTSYYCVHVYTDYIQCFQCPAYAPKREVDYDTALEHLRKEGYGEDAISFIRNAIDELQEDLRQNANRIFRTITAKNGQRFEFFSSSEAALDTASAALQGDFESKTLYIEYEDGSYYYNDEEKKEEGSFNKTAAITTLYYCPNRHARVVQIYGKYYIRSYKTFYEYTPFNDTLINEVDWWIAVGRHHNVGAPNPEKEMDDLINDLFVGKYSIKERTSI